MIVKNKVEHFEVGKIVEAEEMLEERNQEAKISGRKYRTIQEKIGEETRKDKPVKLLMDGDQSRERSRGADRGHERS